MSQSTIAITVENETFTGGPDHAPWFSGTALDGLAWVGMFIAACRSSGWCNLPDYQGHRYAALRIAGLIPCLGGTAECLRLVAQGAKD